MEGQRAEVLWASDLLTNAAIIGRLDLLDKAQTEFMELARGARSDQPLRSP